MMPKADVIILPNKDDKFAKRVATLKEEFTTELGKWVREKIPPMMANDEFAAVSAALLIAINRNLAEVAVAFTNANGQSEEEIGSLVTSQFVRNYANAMASAQAMADVGTVQ